MKKEYISPLVEVTTVDMEMQLMAGSAVGTDVYDDNADAGEDILSREFPWME